VSKPARASDWAQLFRIACSLIRQVNSQQPIIGSWTFGGGTAMMLQIDHRESHDVDIFLPDPQLLSFLDPKLRDFDFEIAPSDYDGDGSSFLKIAFEDVGQIDFIVGRALTSSPAIEKKIENEVVQLEAITEIITKKIYHRGASIQPRDIFDVAAASEQFEENIILALRNYPEKVAITLTKINQLNPEFVQRAISALAIKDKYKPTAPTALEKTKSLLSKV
jgi:hypothetical protein